MTGGRHDDFYVGYVDETPPGVGRFARRLAVGLIALTAALGLGLALLLERFDEGVFEYGTVRDYSGELLVDPHPRLLTADGPADGYLLVAVGKHGLGVDMAPSPPRQPGPPTKIDLAGTLIQNPEAAMLEVHSLTLPDGYAADAGSDTEPADSSEAGGSASDDERAGPTAGAEAATADVRLVVRGDQLVGEIVDTKCYLGAMKPGRGKPHRDCASLCIRGGIPAALLVRTENGERHLVHLVSFGRPVGEEVLDFVGQPVEVTGLLRRKDGRLLLDAYFLTAIDSSIPPLDLLRRATSGGPESKP
ncbi:MAG: hypothetical protein OXH70_13215 [Acidobacteria bacterium]|nr:hypothetical protein [Acidobacteriota bacterium]